MVKDETAQIKTINIVKSMKTAQTFVLIKK